MTYDFFAAGVVGDPHSLLRRLRAEAPVHWSPQLGGWVLTRYEDVLAAARDRRLRAPSATGWLDRLPEAQRRELQPARDSLRLWAGFSDEQDHLDFQRALKKYFTPARVELLRPRVRHLTDALLHAVRARGTLEVVEELARPLSAGVIGELLGLPAEHHGKLLRWSTDLQGFFQHSGLEGLRQGQRSLLELQELLRPLIAERRRAPGEDLISVLVSREEGFFAREPEAVVANCAMLLFSGQETTSHVISRGVLLLLEHPEQWALLRSQPGLLPSAIEEMLRYDAAVDAMIRVSHEPVELAGRTFPAGAPFILVYKAANRDPEVFPEPDRFDITREPNRHLAFGMGTYYCLGAALARLETETSVQALLEQLPEAHPAFEPPDWKPLPPLGRRLRSLRVAF